MTVRKGHERVLWPWAVAAAATLGMVVSGLMCTTSFGGSPEGVCGNGRIDEDEECDDGNSQSGDGCSPECRVEEGWACVGGPSRCTSLCGDGRMLGEEECDDGNSVSQDGCSSSCRIEDGWECDGTPSECTPVCGDGNLTGDEECDGTAMSKRLCSELDLGDGTLGCSEDCTFDLSGCSELPLCGNGRAEYGEACDGDDLAGKDCSAFGFYGGNLACSEDCRSFDTSGCSGRCGNGVAEGDEVCDGEDLRGATCESRGYLGGTLICARDCASYVESQCIAGCAGNCQNPSCEGEPCGGNGRVCSGGSCVCSGNGGPAEASERTCGDGHDNDCDGLADCSDSDCTGDACGSNGRVCSGGSCVCSGNGGPAEASERTCGDGHDNDCDGMVDCSDSNCAGDPCGANGRVCSSGVCVCSGNGGPVEISERTCGDGHDNDCDGLADCSDPDCEGDACGANGMVCSSGSCVCSGNGGWPNVEEILCTDTNDNDCDGLTDSDDPDCSCGAHSQPPCPDTGCHQGVQICPDNNGELGCWFCCSTAPNGVCGTWIDGTPCGSDPEGPHYDVDC